MPKQHGFRARLLLLPTEHGGRSGPIFSGYRSLLAFGTSHDGARTYSSCIVTLQGVNQVLPGQEFEADILPLKPELLEGEIKPHRLFDMTEGRRVVAKGEVIAQL
jgi:translation elongation factor EF-Tu-like GTPase